MPDSQAEQAVMDGAARATLWAEYQEEAMAQTVAARDPIWAGKQNAAFHSDYLEVAERAEWHFGNEAGLMPNRRNLPGGDGGVDFRFPALLTVDVKGIHYGDELLLHKIDKPIATAYVLVEIDLVKRIGHSVGWVWGTELMNAPVGKVRPDGYDNFKMHRDQLHPMKWFWAMRMVRGGDVCFG